jgi:hypothetical protein
MKTILFSFMLVLTIFSCKKDPLNEYNDAGVLPAAIDDRQTLNGTTWVLTHFNKGFVSESPNDTIVFNSANTYTLKGKSNAGYKYMLVKVNQIGNPFNLELYGFSPFGNNGSWGTTIVNSFIDEGEINLAEFKSLYSNNSSVIKADFKRIK